MSAPERDGRFAEGQVVPPEDGVNDERRREFLVGVKRWSLAVVGLVTAGAVLAPGEAHAWSNGAWVNRRGGWVNGASWSNHGGGWVNRAGGWINGRAGGWVNGGGSQGHGWANRAAGTAGWVNHRNGGGHSAAGWVNR